ncbi:MAG: hypothetical protein JWN11_850 [Hyphomicrobiales bacterium]|nr:hypothetical protein [Hyphomicrobiales bacterium]
MSTPTAEPAAPLNEVMLAMDVVDTLRHSQDLAMRELDAGAREARLIAKLREIYQQQGIEVSDAILKEGVAALDQSRFTYTPPKRGPGLTLARIYAGRKGWGRWGSALLIALVIGLGGYFGVYRPFRASQVEAARVELVEGLPAQMDALYQTIFNETKVQTAVADADDLRARGKTAAKDGDRKTAENAVTSLTALRDLLRQEYSLKVVSRDGVKTGFWKFPKNNSEATNYYLVVEAVGSDNKPLTLPVLDEESGKVETVAMWGIRVPDSVYNSVAADKQDDGIIEHSIVGLKQFGFTDVDYTIPVLGGAVTRW